MKRILMVFTVALVMAAVNASVAFADVVGPWPVAPGQHDLADPTPQCWPGFEGHIDQWSGDHANVHDPGLC